MRKLLVLAALAIALSASSALAEVGILYGWVFDDNGSMANETVNLYQGGTLVDQTTTNSNGYYEFYSVAPWEAGIAAAGDSVKIAIPGGYVESQQVPDLFKRTQGKPGEEPVIDP